MRHCKADLITSFGENYLPSEWAHTTGKRPVAPDLPRRSLQVPQSTGPDCALLPPRSARAALVGTELAAMRAVLGREDATQVPPDIVAKKYFRANLTSGLISDSKPVGSNCDTHRRQTYLVRINSTERGFLSDWTVAVRPVSTFGAVLHYAAVFIDGIPMGFAYVERVKSAKDRRGRYGYASSMHGIECFIGLGGVSYYVPIGSVGKVVSTLESDGVRFLLFTREPFSEGQ